MKVLGCIFLCVTGFCSAQQGSPSDRTATEAASKMIRADAIRAHMRFLSDSLLEGRAPGTRGYDIAAKYVAAQLEGMGLQPAGEKGAWFQTVPLRKAVNIAEKSWLKLSEHGKELTLKAPEDFLFIGDLSRTEADVEGKVVFVGYGVTAPELDYDDYAGVDVRGKIVACLSNAPPRFSASVRGYYADDVMKRRNAAAHGAVGMLVFLLADDEKRHPFKIYFTELYTGNWAWLDLNGEPSEALPEIRAWAALTRHGAELLFDNAPKKLEEVFAAADASQPQSFPLAWTAKLHTASSHSSVVSANIAAKLSGSDPALRDEFIVYSAHLDHLGICPPIAGDNVCHGAIDNASGVGTLLEIARAYTMLPHPPRRSILFLFVTGEEMGTTMEGSDYFAHYPTISKANIVADVNIDGAPGLVYWSNNLTALGAEHSSLGKNAERAAGETGYQLIPDVSPEEDLFIRSDQYSFVLQGIPALKIGNGGRPPDDVRKLFAGHYHTPLDNMEQPLDYNAGARAAGMIFLVGYDVAQQDQRPKWNDDDFFGKMFSPAH